MNERFRGAKLMRRRPHFSGRYKGAVEHRETGGVTRFEGSLFDEKEKTTLAVPSGPERTFYVICGRDETKP